LNVTRIAGALRKRARARRLGLNLWRSEAFTAPDAVTLHGKRVALRLPREQGVDVAFSELLFADCYGLEDAPGPVRTVLDIGGNVGLFAVAARLAFPDAIIHSYEPNPNLEPYLSAQAEAANSKYFLEAVELEDCRVRLNFHEDSVQTTSQVDASSEIPATAFRKTVERLGGSVDFAKVDCEGAEWRIWQDREAWQKVRTLSTEYHIMDGHTHEEAHEVISGLGFQVLHQERADTFGVIRAVRGR